MLSEYLVILLLKCSQTCHSVCLFEEKSMILNMKLTFFTCAVYLVTLIFLFLFLVCHFQFSESVDCNLAAYMYLCLYPILGFILYWTLCTSWA